MAGLDYSKLDYSKLDYSKLDPMQMGNEECHISKFEGQVLSDALKDRLFRALDRAQELKLGDDVYNNIEHTIGALYKSDELFQEYNELLCW
ncbi:hypothetical protein [Enhygromyxa salina]|nr:hypothetical protein [Enhygromyxa salina]